MTFEELKEMNGKALSIFRAKYPYVRLSMDNLEDLRSSAWLELLQWQRRVSAPLKVITSDLLARAMHFLHIKAWKREQSQREWVEVFTARLDTHESNRAIVRDLLDSVPDKVRNVISLRLEGYSKDEIAVRINASASTVARRIADFERIALAV